MFTNISAGIRPAALIPTGRKEPVRIAERAGWCETRADEFTKELCPVVKDQGQCGDKENSQR